MAKRSTPIRGLQFSWKRLLGISRLRTRIARKYGVPTTRGGIQRKLGARLLKGTALGQKRRKSKKRGG